MNKTIISQKEVLDCMKVLREKYPLDRAVKVKVTLCPNGIEYTNGMKVHGCADVTADVAEIHIDTSRNKWVLYSVIAHEYRHVMQRVNSGLVVERDIEHDAVMFGNRFSRKYLGYPGC